MVLTVARAVPETLYYRCPVCSKRFPGSAFEENDLQAECVACGSLVDSPYAISAPNDRVVDLPFTLPEISHELNPAGGPIAQTADITQQLRQAFEALSHIDKTRFLEETLPKVDLPMPSVQETATGATGIRLIAIGALLVIGTVLLTLLYFQV